MADVFSKAKRSAVMARIRLRGNKDTELALAKLFRQQKITDWRRQVNLTVGRRRRKEAHSFKKNPVRVSSTRLLRVRPDFIFPKLKLAIFVDGCFWHGCPRHATQPKSNRVFWKKKLSQNISRDRRVNRALRRLGWQVIRIWECSLRGAAIQSVLRRVRRVWR